MKSIIKVLGVLLLAVFIFSSCSKDKDPADTDLFAGTFRGSIGYIDGEKNISQDNGSVFVTKVGANYNFRFSDAIPDLTGVEFNRADDNTYTSVSGAGIGSITINKDKLTIAFTKDNRAWRADCTR